MKSLILIVLILFISLNFTYGACKDGQVDINNAPIEELDKLTGIGSVRAQAIIDARPFETLDNLMNVVGIGEITLEKIKQQNIACVQGDEKYEEGQEENADGKENPEEQEKEKREEKQEDEEMETEKIKIISPTQNPAKITSQEIKTIELNPSPKGIKSEINKEELNKNKLPVYGLITFCILLSVLFVIRKEKNGKTEFN